ncbi:MAG TPA: FAD-dependent oxidoreductase [Syntrophales bacterium]|nr:FAD-dependent oxidoreductase [Syntrophales bacterium]
MSKISLFLCNCFGEIGKVIDLESLKKRLETDPAVESITIVDSLCMPGDAAKAQVLIRERGIGKVLIGGCSPYGKMEFVKLGLAKEGTDIRTVRTVDLREGCAWIHGKDPEGATRKAANQLEMELALLQNMRDSKDVAIGLQQEALVIGAGPAGLSAASGLARLGFKSHLVDRGSAPGGLLNVITKTYPTDEPGPEKIKSLVDETGNNPLIRFYAKTKVSSVKGYAGDFKVKLAGPGGDTALRVGAVVLATGARILFPQKMYGYGKIKNVITQMEMERRFATGALNCKRAVFIQCVGARSADRPYCSTICCPLSLKNAMRIVDETPGAMAYVLHRDIMTPGSLLEAYYRKALQKGVQFIRFDADRPPEVRGQEQVSGVEVFDTISGVNRVIESDLLVLSTPFIPDPESAALAGMFDIPVDKYGFYSEGYPIHPLETRNDGIFICGTARWPVSSDQAIAQGEAAAMKAASFLGKNTVSALTMSRVPGGKLGHASADAAACTGCGNCVAVCPYKACRLQRMGNRSVSRVIKVRCKSCGNCISVCPNGAMQMPEQNYRVTGEIIRRAFREVR